MREDLAAAGGIAILGMLVGLAPLVVGAMYAVRPTERRLALMRPLSLATIFAALCTLLSGLAAVLRGVAATETWTAIGNGRVAHGLSETMMPMFIAFALLTVAWLCVAVGLRREG